MFGETLLLGRVRNEEERRRSLEIITNEATRLGNQVESVLTFSRSERLGLKLNRKASDVAALVQLPGLRRFVSSAHTDDDFAATIDAVDRACKEVT